MKQKRKQKSKDILEEVRKLLIKEFCPVGIRISPVRDSIHVWLRNKGPYGRMCGGMVHLLGSTPKEIFESIKKEMRGKK